MKISIVTAYYNRKKLFYNTLSRLQLSVVKDFEVIAVDDGSSDDNRLEDLQKEFSFLKVIRLDPKNKWYRNPCVPFNIGFNAASGDIVILQNPECIHYGDILKYVANHLKPNDYISFASYSLDKATTDEITPYRSDRQDHLKHIKFISKKVEADGEEGWYNHSTFNPKGFHWCAAITRNDLKMLGGFDEQFALGVAFDDNEFLERIKIKPMNFQIVDEPFVLHQNHYFFDKETKKNINEIYLKKDGKFLYKKNEYLFERTIQKKEWRVKSKPKNILLLNDFLLTVKLKLKEKMQPFSWRVRNKIIRTIKL
jgi:glycosyltransferase involved in cell wall biosynthesis